MARMFFSTPSLLLAALLTSPACLIAQSEGADLQAFAQPHAFVANQGQWNPDVQFRSRKGPTTSWFTRKGWVVRLQHTEARTLRPDELSAEQRDLPGPHFASAKIKGAVVRMTFAGAPARRPVTGEQELPGLYNFFLGNDASKWETGVPSYQQIRYPSLYTGVDVVVREGTGLFEYDILLAPKADLDQVVIRCEGIEGLEIAEDGSLVIETAVGRSL